ncbi:MAG: LVIVD repeat-containing protein [Promethearchaeota archaeon]
MKNINKSKKNILILAVIFTLSTTFLALYYSIDPGITSLSLLKKGENENIKTMPLNEPESSRVSMNITKTANILNGAAQDVIVIGSLAYVVLGFDGLIIIDISDSTNPVELGQFYDGGNAKCVYVSGSYAYLSEGSYGLEIINIADPTNPTKVGDFYDGREARDIYLSGSYAYVANWDDGLEIVDISDPTNPALAGLFNDGGCTYDVYVSGSYVYVADGIDGLEILHLTEIGNSITITAPTSSSSWEIKSSYIISWESIGYISKVHIEVFEDGQFQRRVNSNVSNSGEYNWTVFTSLKKSKNHQIKIIDATDNSVYGISENFEIFGGSSIPGYNPILLLVAMDGISVIIALTKRKK